jgi:hypothetical protein
MILNQIFRPFHSIFPALNLITEFIPTTKSSTICIGCNTKFNKKFCPEINETNVRLRIISKISPRNLALNKNPEIGNKKPISMTISIKIKANALVLNPEKKFSKNRYMHF